jgi:hypothetical protein
LLGISRVRGAWFLSSTVIWLYLTGHLRSLRSACPGVGGVDSKSRLFDTSLRSRKPALLAFCAGIGLCRARNWCICIHEASCSLAVAVESIRLLIHLHQPSFVLTYSCIRSVFCSLFHWLSFGRWGCFSLCRRDAWLAHVCSAFGGGFQWRRASGVCIHSEI